MCGSIFDPQILSH